MSSTKIEWTDETWNPITGCTKISPGCKYCYAETMHERLRLMGQSKYREHFDFISMHPSELNRPKRWYKSRMVFVCSMSDLFHKNVANESIQLVFDVMNSTPRHTYQVLTKRPDRAAILSGSLKWTDNIWLGVTAENQQTEKERCPILAEIPAKIKFVSYEPALERVIFAPMSTGLNWIIAGCESGPHARPAEADWFRSVRDQCVDCGIPFFLKQMKIDGKIVRMPRLDGDVWNQMPR